MPHAVVEGDVSLSGIFQQLDEVMEAADGRILKTTGAYLSQDGKAVLIEALAIEQGEKRPFLALISQRDDGAVVRLHGSADDLEKTDGVKRILALLASQLLVKIDGTSLGKTNLETFIDQA